MVDPISTLEGTGVRRSRPSSSRKPKLTISPFRGVAYRTRKGTYYLGSFEEFLCSEEARQLRGRVQLIFTSPPFALNKKKRYGNRQGQVYIDWLARMAPHFSALLSPTGSIVIELGNAWAKGQPEMDPLSLEALLGFLRAGKFHLCQQFIGYNRAKLPTPAEWVTIRRVRVKDAFTHIWWMAPTPTPYANNRNVLKDYSPEMERLLRTKKYNAGRRPSEHVISETSFLTRNPGAIPPNVIEYVNTRPWDDYTKYCERHRITKHPARMPREIPKFFIEFLTRRGQLVLDPFGGSNVTGAVAEALGRRWVSIDPVRQYASGSRGRFEKVRVGPALHPGSR